MSDTRRRRKSEESGASDDLSSSFDELNTTKETQNSEPVEITRDSEYDTTGSDGESDGGSQDGVQRESGDGQEEDKPQKKLDDDEDRRNPQYIPKRGTFYEHDDRTTEEIAEDAVEQPTERETKEKKVWKDKEDKWNHDRYNDDEQAPKSHEELIAVYGYDIRNEEGPPRARRRRRYGRGPNKYTRNWEDEDAYGKTAGNITSTKPNKRINKTGEEFPALGGSKDVQGAVDEPVISSAWYSNKNKSSNKQQNFPPLQPQQENQKAKLPGAISTLTNENKAPNEPTNPAWKKDAKYTTQSLSPNRNNTVGDVEKTIQSKPTIHSNKRQVQESVSLATSKARGRGFKPSANNNMVTNRTVDSKPKGRGSGVISGDIRRNNTSQHEDEQQLVNELKHMNVHEGSSYHHQGRQQNKNFYPRPNVATPRMQQPVPSQPPQQNHSQPQPPPDVAGNRPKRYSSLRQRPTIPEGPGQQPYQPPHTQHGFYPPQGGNSHGVLESQGFPQGHFEPTAQVPTAPTPLAAQSVMPLPAGGQSAPYAPPPYLVPPPQFIPPQTAPPSIINYVPGPSGPTFQPNFQGYQGYNPTVPPQGPPPPPELYQPQGCTYYNPAQQPPQQPQVAPVRRPKAAIPILPPPDNSQHYQTSRGRGRNVSQPHQGISPGYNNNNHHHHHHHHHHQHHHPVESEMINETIQESNSQVSTEKIESIQQIPMAEPEKQQKEASPELPKAEPMISPSVIEEEKKPEIVVEKVEKSVVENQVVVDVIVPVEEIKVEEKIIENEEKVSTMKEKISETSLPVETIIETSLSEKIINENSEYSFPVKTVNEIIETEKTIDEIHTTKEIIVDESLKERIVNEISLTENTITIAPLMEKTIIEAPLIETKIIESSVIEKKVIDDALISEKTIIETSLVEKTVIEPPISDKTVNETSLPEKTIIETPISDKTVIETLETSLPVKTIEIDAPITIEKSEITKVDNVVHENPVVEETVA